MSSDVILYRTGNRWCISPLISILTLSYMGTLAGSLPVLAAETFNPNMLVISGANNLGDVDLNYFANKGGQIPGTYLVDVYFNGDFVESRNVSFVVVPDNSGRLMACLTPQQLSEQGVKLSGFPDLKKAPESKCLPQSLAHYIPDATESFDLNNLRLDLTVPQASLDQRAQGMVDPKYWDEGIPSLQVNYAYTGSTNNNTDDNSRTTNNFLNLRSGANLGPWRLRNYATFSDNSGGNNNSDNNNLDENGNRTDGNDDNDNNGPHWKSINTYVQRNFRMLQGGQLTLGEYSTPSDVFDSVQFKGAQFASDDSMLPDSMSQFAPTVRGIAKSNAQVTVRQNGNTIYQTYVPPGPFIINDLYPSGSGGDLQVSVKESDGKVTQYSQSFASLPVLQREGRFKYGLTAGQYRSGNNDTQTPSFGQGTLIYGLPAGFTLYGGGQYAENYTSGAFGIGKDMGFLGALSVDVTTARSQFDNEIGTKTGQSYRVMYARSFESTDTDLQVTAYRFNSRGYYSMTDVQDYNSDSGSDIDVYDRTHTKRSKFQLSISQPLGDFGSISVSGSQQDYWDESGTEQSWQSSYNTSYGGITYSLAYGYTKNPGDVQADQTVAFNVSVPLDRWLSSSHAWASYTMNTNQKGDTTHQAGISGTALEQNNLSYSLMQGYGNHGEGSSGTASTDYKGGYGEINAGYNYDDNSRQLNYGAQGGILIHGNGVTLSQQLGETVALVKAPGASDVAVLNNTGVHTDWRGYTVVPYMQPYRRSRVSLDTQSFGDNVDIEATVKNVVPTRGAVVLADFKPRVGQRALITLTYHGKPVPFGATATQDQTDNTGTGIVSNGGQVYLTGLPDSGVLIVKWGSDNRQQCRARYTLPVAGTSADLIPQVSATCQ
ncbi:fimbrial biogenesis outer membrane usher protein (plasmid) [Hafnia alvei]|uniref:fimbria/pilus outer membrane usher protein n=1 Tax=Hafnia alvei TaxID=569 RepID=UPI000C9FFA10|nr:fimbria/pilus outer membrane usher protein [Hafnia alvei]MBI0278572.1 fimbrial biogenesis outer membrane usher protein [Hafnia alvei]PNL03869.1 fimbrial biogenesis outer membrane usher protein [Hafnia alvei]